jgi:integrase
MDEVAEEGRPRGRAAARSPALHGHDDAHGRVPVSVVAGRLGHARPATTLNVYSHFVDAGDKVAADVLAKIVDEASAAAT